MKRLESSAAPFATPSQALSQTPKSTPNRTAKAFTSGSNLTAKNPGNLANALLTLGVAPDPRRP